MPAFIHTFHKYFSHFPSRTLISNFSRSSCMSTFNKSFVSRRIWNGIPQPTNTHNLVRSKYALPGSRDELAVVKNLVIKIKSHSHFFSFIDYSFKTSSSMTPWSDFYGFYCCFRTSFIQKFKQKFLKNYLNSSAFSSIDFVRNTFSKLIQLEFYGKFN